MTVVPVPGRMLGVTARGEYDGTSGGENVDQTLDSRMERIIDTGSDSHGILSVN